MSEWSPRVGDMVLVDVRGVPSVGMVIEIVGDHILVAGGRWKEKFHIDSVKHLAESELRNDYRC